MIHQKKVVCIIPARLNSSRFPRKILAPLNGKPLIQWVWEAALKVPFFDEVAFAIDSLETAEVVSQFQGKFFMTSSSCESGTERLVELRQKNVVQADIWVNWQADEPFISETLLRDLLSFSTDERVDVWTLKEKITDESLVLDPNCVKVVTDLKDFALYFSRSPIPYYRNRSSQKYFKHIGLYAYSDKALREIASMKPSELAVAESLEQLTFLSHGLKIRVSETKEKTIGIDLPEHLCRAEAWLKESS